MVMVMLLLLLMRGIARGLKYGCAEPWGLLLITEKEKARGTWKWEAEGWIHQMVNWSERAWRRGETEMDLPSGSRAGMGSDDRSTEQACLPSAARGQSGADRPWVAEGGRRDAVWRMTRVRVRGLAQREEAVNERAMWEATFVGNE